MVPGIDFVPYKNEDLMHDMITLIEKDLSEPYSIFTYRSAPFGISLLVSVSQYAASLC